MGKKPPKPADRPAQPRFKAKEITKTAPASGLDFTREFQAITTMQGGFAFAKDALDDTTVAVSATGVIEEYLRLALVSRFRKQLLAGDMADIFEGYGPLASFSSKVRMCSVMGLATGDIKNDLQVVGKIRNIFCPFAHS